MTDKEREREYAESAKELMREIEQIDGVKDAMVDDYVLYGGFEASCFVTPEDEYNAHSVSQVLRNTITDDDTFNIKGEIITPSDHRNATGMYEIELTTL